MAAAAVALAACGSTEEGGVGLSWVPDVAPGTIVSVVGGAEDLFEGLEGKPTEVRLNLPVDLDFDAAGNLYVAERYNHRILKLDPSGKVSVVAGIVDETGWAENGFSGDGGPATEAKLNQASTIATGPDGTLYIADAGNHRIRMIDEDGVITTVAGNGRRGFSGDGGPATKASLSNPLGLTLDGEGNLYFLDAENFRIRRVDRDGIITTVAGTGEAGLSPDGTPAERAMLGWPSDHMPIGLEFTPAGELLFTDMGNRRIGLIDAEGRVQTVAGGADFETAGGVSDPLDIAVGGDGTLYIATHTHGAEGNLVHAVGPNGVITTLAGSMTGYSGDGGPASEARLDIPAGLEIGPDGNLYVADARNNVIRMIALP